MVNKDNELKEFKKDMFGYPQFNEYNPNTGGAGTIIPIKRFSKVVPNLPSVMQLPYAINDDEVFTPITPLYTGDTSGRYIVSNYGRVYDFAFRRFVPCRDNDKYTINKLNCGYSQCHLSKYVTPFEQKSFDYYVHRIVLMSFNYVKGCEVLEVNHKNGITNDNRLCNLEWVTPEENIKNDMKWLKRSEFLVDPSEPMIHMICQMLDAGMNPYDIAVKTTVHLYYIQGLLDGTKARDITSQYKFYERNKSIYPDCVIHYLCQCISNGVSAKDIEYNIGIGKCFIRDIADRKIYTRISNQYSFINSHIEEKFSNAIPDNYVHEICRLFSNGYSTTDVLNIFKNQYDIDLNIHQLQKIKLGSTYKDISCMYNTNYSKSTIDDSTIRAICIDMQNGLSNGAISSKYNISAGTIGRIRRRETYTDISKDYNFMNADEATRLANSERLSDALVINICNLLMNRETPTNVANKLGVKLSTVNNIKNHTGYTHISKNYDFPMLENRLSEDTIRDICKDIFIYRMRNIDIISKYRVSADTVKRIKSGKMHKDISKDYMQ